MTHPPSDVSTRKARVYAPGFSVDVEMVSGPVEVETENDLDAEVFRVKVTMPVTLRATSFEFHP